MNTSLTVEVSYFWFSSLLVGAGVCIRYSFLFLFDCLPSFSCYILGTYGVLA